MSRPPVSHPCTIRDGGARGFRAPAGRRFALAVAATVSLVVGAACSSDDQEAGASAEATTTAADTTGASGASTGGAATTEAEADPDVDAVASDEVEPGDFYDGDVHTIEVTLDQADVDAAIAAYQESGAKEWIEVAVAIDGTTYDQAGMRLKGNSSLMAVGGGAGRGFPGARPVGEALDCAVDAASDDAATDDAATDDAAGVEDPIVEIDAGQAAEELPWLIRLDKFVDDQSHQGRVEFVVRSNTTATALNEAVSLALLGEAGLATQRSSPVRFSVNGSVEQLRLVIEHPDDVWTDEHFGTGGVLFQADAQGDYSYRGDDPAAYTDAWDHEAGEEDDAPLIEFLDFVNNSTDEEFATELADRLDVESFARYLAIEELLGNFDDIDGPGNNSYLYFAADGSATVVAWDHNLALSSGGMGGGMGGGAGGPMGGTRPAPDGDVVVPEGCELPEGFDPSQMMPPAGADGGAGGPMGGGMGGMGGGGNPLVNRFLEVDAFAELVDVAAADLRDELVASGVAAEIVATEAAVLIDQASDLVDAATVEQEATGISTVLGIG